MRVLILDQGKQHFSSYYISPLPQQKQQQRTIVAHIIFRFLAYIVRRSRSPLTVIIISIAREYLTRVLDPFSISRCPLPSGVVDFQPSTFRFSSAFQFPIVCRFNLIQFFLSYINFIFVFSSKFQTWNLFKYIRILNFLLIVPISQFLQIIFKCTF